MLYYNNVSETFMYADRSIYNSLVRTIEKGKSSGQVQLFPFFYRKFKIIRVRRSSLTFSPFIYDPQNLHVKKGHLNVYTKYNSLICCCLLENRKKNVGCEIRL